MKKDLKENGRVYIMEGGGLGPTKFNSKQIGFWIAISIFCVMQLIPNIISIEIMPMPAYNTASVAILMGILWSSNALPLAVTALIPLVLLPLLGVSSFATVATSFSNKLIFLFFGGFMLALSIERTGLHRRMALNILNKVGVQPQNIIGGFMLAVAFLSAWISNSATAAMMLPIVLAVIEVIKSNNGKSEATHNFSRALLLALAYSASIGGVSTLIGTPPNALLASYFAKNYNVDISFSQWIVFATPFSITLLVITWVVLTRVLFKFEKQDVNDLSKLFASELESLGKMNPDERKVLILFSTTAILWIFRPYISGFLPIDDYMIAVGAAIMCFILPSRVKHSEEDSQSNGAILDWGFVSKKMPWGVLLLFGGGLAVGGAVNSSGLANWIVSQLEFLSGADLVIVLLAVATVIVFLTELTSNTATVATFLPLVVGIGVAMGVEPLLLGIPLALAASCAFMLPAATPPNSIVFASEELDISDMIKAGFVINIISIILIVLFVNFYGTTIFEGISSNIT